MKLSISLLSMFLLLSNRVCYAASVVMPVDKVEKLRFIVKSFKMPPERIWLYGFVVIVLIFIMLIDLNKHPKKHNSKKR